MIFSCWVNSRKNFSRTDGNRCLFPEAINCITFRCRHLHLSSTPKSCIFPRKILRENQAFQSQSINIYKITLWRNSLNVEILRRSVLWNFSWLVPLQSCEKVKKQFLIYGPRFHCCHRHNFEGWGGWSAKIRELSDLLE